MNDKDLQDAAEMTGFAQENSRNPEVENSITPPVDSGRLITGAKRAPTDLPGGGESPPPPLELNIRITSPVDGANVVVRNLALD